MSVITMPSNLSVAEQKFGEKRFDLSFSGGDNGANQSRVLAPMRWTCGIVSASTLSQAAAAVWRSMILDLNGRVNQLAVYDWLNVAPLGSARGTWTAASGAAAGATSLSVAMGAGQAGKTVLRGDWIGVNQSGSNRQLLPVAADAVADGSGNITLLLNVPLRVAVASASSIIWDKPTTLMRRTSSEASWSSHEIVQGGFSLDLMESWE